MMSFVKEIILTEDYANSYFYRGTKFVSCLIDIVIIVLNLC